MFVYCAAWQITLTTEFTISQLLPCLCLSLIVKVVSDQAGQACGILWKAGAVPQQ